MQPKYKTYYDDLIDFLYNIISFLPKNIWPDCMFDPNKRQNIKTSLRELRYNVFNQMGENVPKDVTVKWQNVDLDMFRTIVGHEQFARDSCRMTRYYNQIDANTDNAFYVE